LVDDIAVIAKLETDEDAIFIAQDEITYLDELSLDERVPSNIPETSEEDLYR
jgi:hypothetical protein